MGKKNNQVPQKIYDRYLEVLEAFAVQYGLDFKVFHITHLRLEGLTTIVDCWPTTGRYWVKQSGLGEGNHMGEKGYLPRGYKELDARLSELFKRDVEAANAEA